MNVQPQLMTMGMEVLQKTIFPMVFNYVTTHLQNQYNRKSLESEARSIQLLESAYNKLGKGEKTDKPNVKVDDVDVTNFEDINDYHLAKWNQYFDTLRELPDNAPKDDVIQAMKAIKKDIQNYGCLSCRINANEVHMPALKAKGKDFVKVMDKPEALTRLCEFKNEINESLGKSIFNCEQVL